MSGGSKVVVVDDPQAGRSERQRLFMNAFRVSQWLRAPLRVLTANFERLVSGASLVRKEVSRYRIEWIALENGRAYANGVMTEVETIEQGLLMLGIGPRERERGRVGGWRARLLESCRVPVLMVPSAYELHPRGFQSFFVPMSGETRSNSALDWAIRRGNELGVPVDILHVTEEVATPACDSTIVGHVSDEFHHEYPRLIEEFISEASPFTSSREKQVIRDFLHCAGNPIELLSVQMRKRKRGLLVLEWKGHLETGRARLVKYFTGSGDIPILLVRQLGSVRSRLRVGKDFRAA